MEKTYLMPALAALALLIYSGSILLAWVSGEETLMTAMLGSTVPLASAVIQYYFGSSRSSREKDETIASVATSTIAPLQK